MAVMKSLAVVAVAGASLPSFIKDEFDAFLECGILAHGFLRRTYSRGSEAGRSQVRPAVRARVVLR